MILSSELIWLHLPRTGGTTTVEVFRRAIEALPERESSDWWIDDDSLRDKHDNLDIRQVRRGSLPPARRIAMNFRPLEEWLYSNWKWAVAMGLNVDVNRYKSGEFFSLRLGRWCPADWWLDYFGPLDDYHFIRTTHLATDLAEVMADVGLSFQGSVPKLNGLTASEKESVSQFRTEHSRDLNPKWVNCEFKLWPS